MYSIIPTERFSEDVEYYVKKKKYRHIADDIKSVTDELQKGNLIGDDIPGLKLPDDNHAYKVRAVNSDTKGGKSNGYRVIYYVIKDDMEIYLITIYYKKDADRIPTSKDLTDWILESL